MLWMKGWLESRWRLALALFLPLFSVAVTHREGVPSPEAAQRMIFGVSTMCMAFSCLLAGSGVKTQPPPLQQARGMPGSIYFTLSLPVSRLRLLTVRAALGLLETWGLTALLFGAAWALFPQVRGNSTPADLFKFLMAASLFLTGSYFLAVLLSTFLDEPWATWGSILATLLVLWVGSHVSIPHAVNIFRFFAEDSPLLTHRLPWSQMATSAGLAVILFLAAVRVVETREY